MTSLAGTDPQIGERSPFDGGHPSLTRHPFGKLLEADTPGS